MQMYERATLVKITIPTSRDFGSVEWIIFHYYYFRYLAYLWLVSVTTWTIAEPTMPFNLKWIRHWRFSTQPPPWNITTLTSA